MAPGGTPPGPPAIRGGRLPFGTMPWPNPRLYPVDPAPLQLGCGVWSPEGSKEQFSVTVQINPMLLHWLVNKSKGFHDGHMVLDLAYEGMIVEVEAL